MSARWAIQEWLNLDWYDIGVGETFSEEQMLGYLNSHFSISPSTGQHPWQVKSVAHGEIILTSLSVDGAHTFTHRFIRR